MQAVRGMILAGGMVLAAFNARADTVPPGTDLTQLILKAPTDTTFTLAAGTYPGVIAVSGKEVTLQGVPGTVLTGDAKYNAVASVRDNGALTIIGAEIKGMAPDAILVSEQAASLVLRDCSFTGPAKVAVYADGGTASLFQGRISAAETGRIYGRNGAALTVDQVAFEGGGQPGVVLSGGVLTLTAATFKGFANAIIAEGPASLSVSGSQFLGGAGDAMAVVLKGGKAVSIRGNTLTGAGLWFEGGFSQALEVADNAIQDAPASAVTSKAVVDGGLEGAVLRLTGNRIVGAKDNAVLLSAAASAELLGNQLVARDGAGLFLQNGAVAHLKDNLLYGAMAPFRTHSSAGKGSRSDGDLFIGADRVPDGIEATAATDRLIRAQTHQDVEALNDIVAATLQAASDARGEWMQDLQDAFVHLSNAGGALGGIRLVATDAAGTEFYPAFRAAAEGGESYEAAADAAEALVVPPGEYRISTAVTDAPIAVTVGQGAVQTVTIAAPDYLAVPFRLEYSQKQKLAPLVTRPIRLLPPMERKRRLASFAPRGANPLNKNRYQLQVPRIGADAARWERARSLADRRLADALSDLPDLTRGIAAVPIPKRADNPDFRALWDRYQAAKGAFAKAVPLLSLTGGKETAQKVLSLGDDAPGYRDRLEFYVLAGWIELRLGNLDQGGLVRRLASDNVDIRVASAVALTFFGSERGAEPLLSYLAGVTPVTADHEMTGDAFLSVLNLDDGGVADFARQVIAATHANEAKTKPYNPLGSFSSWAIPYLIANGQPEDLKAVAGLPVAWWLLEPFSLLVADPAELAAIYIDSADFYGPEEWRYNDAQTIEGISVLCPSFRDHPSPEAAGAFPKTQFAFGQKAQERNPREMNVSFFAASFLSQASGACMASHYLAKAVIDNRAMGEWPWKPTVSEKVRNPLYLTPEEIDQQVAQTVEGSDEDRELTALRQSLSRSLFQFSLDYASADVMRQPVVVRHLDDPAGAISAVVGLHPSVDEGRIRLGLTIDSSGFKRGTLADVIANDPRDYRRYPDSAGKALISSVRLYRDGTEVPIRAAGQIGRGEFLFETADKTDDFAGLVALVELDVFGSKDTLYIPVFGTRFAARWGMLKAAPAVAEAAVAADPSPRNRLALARALEAAGETKRAAETFIAILDEATPRARFYVSIADQFVAIGHPDLALKVLRAGLGKLPDHPELNVAAGDVSLMLRDLEGAAVFYRRLQPAQEQTEGWRIAFADLISNDQGLALRYFEETPPDGPRRELALQMAFLLRGWAGLELAPIREKIGEALAQLQDPVGREAKQRVELYKHLLQDRVAGMPDKVPNSWASCDLLFALGAQAVGVGRAEEGGAFLQAAQEICPPYSDRSYFAAVGLRLLAIPKGN